MFVEIICVWISVECLKVMFKSVYYISVYIFVIQSIRILKQQSKKYNDLI